MNLYILIYTCFCISKTEIEKPLENPLVSKLFEKVKESPNESKLFEKINSVVKEFNSYRNRFLMGSKEE